MLRDMITSNSGKKTKYEYETSIWNAIGTVFGEAIDLLRLLRKATVSPFFAPMQFVPVLCQFLHGDAVKSGEI